MKSAWDEIGRLIDANAIHRRGFRLKNVTPEFVLDQAYDEFNELSMCPDDPVEMADLLGCLLHYAYRKGWTLEQLEGLMLAKFRERFTVPEAEMFFDI